MKLTARTRSSSSSAPATSGPPCSTWTAPGGSPAAIAAAPMDAVPCGARSGGLRMTGQPAASAEAALCAAIGAGAFHGHNSSAGPQGRRSISISPAGPSRRRDSTPARSCSAAKRNEPCRMKPSMPVVLITAPDVAVSSAATSGADASSSVGHRLEAVGPLCDGERGPLAGVVRLPGSGESSVDRCGVAGPLLLCRCPVGGVFDPVGFAVRIASHQRRFGPLPRDQVPLGRQLDGSAHRSAPVLAAATAVASAVVAMAGGSER